MFCAHDGYLVGLGARSPPMTFSDGECANGPATYLHVPGDALPVGHVRLPGLDLHAVAPLELVAHDLQVQLAQAAEKHLGDDSSIKKKG